MIEIKKLCKEIKGNMILKDITYQFQRGYIYGVRGVNGSGKTMLIRAIAGLIKPTKGEILIEGKRLWNDISFPPSIGALIENPSFIDDFTGYGNLELLSLLMNNVNDKDIEEALSLTGLTVNANKKHRKYSLGMKQRLGIAAAILGEPEIILLDEPTNALDKGGVKLLISLLKKLNRQDKVVIICSHNQSILEKVCDVFIHMEEGAIVE